MNDEETFKGALKFPKEERLHHRSLIEGLFKGGKSFYEFPFRVIWKIMSPADLEKNFRHRIPEEVGKLQMMVTVPKKRRRKANDRVLMRRRIREAYRTNRLPLKRDIEGNESIGTFSVGIVYIHDKNLSYTQIEGKMKTVISKLGAKRPADASVQIKY